MPRNTKQVIYEALTTIPIDQSLTTGLGTVSSVSVTTANGVSGSVANPTTTPAITLTLGAITPSSVASVGTVTGSNLSGTNTGDQTSIVGITGTMAQFDTAVTDGNIVYQSQALGTPLSGTLTNCTGLPVASGISGLGTGVATALAVNIGSAGAPLLFNGAGGTPSSMVGTNITGTAAGLTAGAASAVAVGGITGLGTGVATALAVNVGSDWSIVDLRWQYAGCVGRYALVEWGLRI